MREEAIQSVFLNEEKMTGKCPDRDVSGERSVLIMNMKSGTSSFPLRAAKISCLLTPGPHSLISLS